MTAFTSAGSGKFNTNATWVSGAGHPSADGDTFVIAAGHSVEYDADNSALTNGFGASTINGTLFASRTAGAYVLKMSATLTVATTGTLDASDGAGGAYPSTCTFSITTGANITLVSVSGSGAVTLRCQNPTHAYALLSQAESSGQTVCHVSTDLTGAGDSTWWANGALVRVNNVNGAQQSEQYTISSVSSTAVTLTGNLSNSKIVGSHIVLVSRNVKLVGAGSVGTAIAGGTSVILNAEIRGFNIGLNGCVVVTVSASVSGNNIGINSCASATTGASLSGNNIGLNSCTSAVVTGPVSGNTTGLAGCLSAVVTGPVSGNGTGLNGCGFSILGSTLLGNGRDLLGLCTGAAYNALFGSAIEYLNYTLNRQPWDYVESYDHDQVRGAYRAWVMGGSTTSVASPVYNADRPRSYNMVSESATYPVFMQTSIRVPAGASIFVRLYIQKDVSMSYLPRLWIFPNSADPLIVGGSPTAEVIMTNSTGVWEVLEATVTNTTNAPVQYMVRSLAKNASGNCYVDPVIRVSSYQFAPDMVGGMGA